MIAGFWQHSFHSLLWSFPLQSFLFLFLFWERKLRLLAKLLCYTAQENKNDNMTGKWSKLMLIHTHARTQKHTCTIRIVDTALLLMMSCFILLETVFLHSMNLPCIWWMSVSKRGRKTERTFMSYSLLTWLSFSVEKLQILLENVNFSSLEEKLGFERNNIIKFCVLWTNIIGCCKSKARKVEGKIIQHILRESIFLSKIIRILWFILFLYIS